MNGFLTVGYEFGAELTYPHAESTTSGLLNAAGELCGVALVLIAGLVLEDWGDLPTNVTLTTILVIGLALSFPISKENLKRLAASNNISAVNCNDASNSKQTDITLETIPSSIRTFGNNESIHNGNGLQTDHLRSNRNALRSVSPAINGNSYKFITQKLGESTINTKNNGKTSRYDHDKSIHMNEGCVQ